MSHVRRELRVFVVDDESLVAMTIGLVLRQHGFEARPFYLPVEALEAARAEAPDLLLSDVIMPGLSGVELAIRVLEECPKCKVLLFSGNPATIDTLAKARNSGHDFEVLPKPVHPTALLEKIAAVMNA